MPARSLRALQAASPPNVTILRQRSAWNNSETCAWIIFGLLARALRPYMADRQPVLLLDAVKIHLTPRVLGACVRSKLWPLVVPPSTTWLLQPLDADAFFLYKLRLRQKYQESRLASASGELGIDEFLRCIYAAVSEVLEGRSWGVSFDKAGYSRHQVALSHRVRDHVEGEVQAGSNWPTSAQFKACFPRRWEPPIELLWQPFRPHPTSAGAAPFAAATSASASASGAVAAAGASSSSSMGAMAFLFVLRLSKVVTLSKSREWPRCRCAVRLVSHNAVAPLRGINCTWSISVLPGLCISRVSFRN